MCHRLLVALGIAALLGMAVGCGVLSPPDLSPKEAADLIARAPEFNRYARLVKVGDIFHYKDSMDSVSDGDFTFQYLNAPADAAPIKATADFRYFEGKWYLNEFSYGSRPDVETVHVWDGRPQRR